jgi:hypothetical protein
MFYALNWFVVFSLFVLWSLGAWAVHAIAGWLTSNAGVLSSGADAVAGIALPQWISVWLSPDIAETLSTTLLMFKPAVEAVLATVPALAGGLSVVIWVLWGLGVALLIVLGLVGSGLIALLRRQAAQVAASVQQQPAAR